MKKKAAKKKSEMSQGELAKVSGGAKNIDDPIVQTVMKAHDKAVKDGQSAARAELLRNNVLGSSAFTTAFDPIK